MSSNDQNKDSTKESEESKKEEIKNESVTTKIDPKEKAAELLEFFKQNTEASVTYLLLALGIASLFFGYILLGSLLVGLIAGYHFAHEIIFYLRNLSHVFAGQDQVRYIVLTAVIIALFIAVPGIFIGAIVAAVFRQVIQG